MNKSLKTAIILFGVCVIIAVFPLLTIKDSEFGGADGAAEEIITVLVPTYEPWFENFLPELGGETESLLFCLQAAIGSGIVFGGFGYYIARKKYSTEK